MRSADASRRLASTGSRHRVRAVAAEHGGHRARIAFDPPLQDLRVLPSDAREEGIWYITADDARITGGSWRMQRRGEQLDMDLAVQERWRPGRLPWLMRLVTTVIPVFRRWPTSYGWHATVTLGPTPTMTSSWHRLPVYRCTRLPTSDPVVTTASRAGIPPHRTDR